MALRSTCQILSLSRSHTVRYDYYSESNNYAYYSHGQLKSTGSCQWNFGRKMENICCNVFHFELKTETSLQNCNLSVSSIQPNQPSDQNHSSDPTLNYSNSNNLDNLNYREFQPSSSECKSILV